MVMTVVEDFLSMKISFTLAAMESFLFSAGTRFELNLIGHEVCGGHSNSYLSSSF